MGSQCPRKLVYARDRRYRNLKKEDSFLQSLAEGGFQIGEFAKAHFEGGVDIDTLDRDEALAQTNALLERESVTIFEAAIAYQDCFIRVDVLEKNGDRLCIHEVKAKSFDSREASPFLTAKGDGIRSTWQTYLYDVAFQKWVVSRAFPASIVTARLMLVDKAAQCPVDGLHQCYEIVRKEGRSFARQRQALSREVIDAKLLKSAPVDAECDLIYSLGSHGGRFEGSFSDLVAALSAVCAETGNPEPLLRKDCGGCEFKTIDADDELLSGFKECVSRATGIAVPQDGALIFDLWDNRRKDRHLDRGIIRLADLTEDDLGQVEPLVDGEGVNRVQRQWLQVERHREGNREPWIDRVGLNCEMESWRFPLHFIDFETTRTALPFYAGHHPYHNIAFQFSHHTVDSEGQVAHRSQFLLADAGENPNVQFARVLKAAIGGDTGTVFMYSRHENTTLAALIPELEAEVDEDSQELIAFIQSLTVPPKNRTGEWMPERPMVDLLEVVKRYVYLPETKGSNSLKAVLPAILNASGRLQDLYSQPVYGREKEIPSLNLEERVWLRTGDHGEIINPYALLPDLAVGLSPEERQELQGVETIKEGGAALTAYARLMFDDLSPVQRSAIERGLLEYCELDTLAMVMLYQGLRDLLERLGYGQ